MKTSNRMQMLQILLYSVCRRTKTLLKIWHIASDFIKSVNMTRTYFMWYIFILSCIFLSCQNKQQQTSTEVVENTINSSTTQVTAVANKKTILCFGNSLTAGYGLDESQSWPSLLQMRLDSLSLPYRVVNAGLSGETTAGGLGRIDWVLNQKVDYFILELGANDMLRGLDVEATEQNLIGIVKRVKEKNPDIKVIIAGMLSPPNMGPDYEKKFNNIYPSLSKTFDATHIPFFLDGVAGIDSLNLPDGKHPNAIGQHIVLENVWNKLQYVI